MLNETNNYLLFVYYDSFYDPIVRHDSAEKNFLIIAKESLDVYYFRYEISPLFNSCESSVPDSYYYNETVEKFSLQDEQAYKIIVCSEEYIFGNVLQEIVNNHQQAVLEDEHISRLVKKI